MPTDKMPLSRAGITSLRYGSRIERGHVIIRRPHGSIDRYDALLNMAERSLDEPARLASARAEGVREGYRAARRWPWRSIEDAAWAALDELDLLDCVEDGELTLRAWTTETRERELAP